MTLDETPAAVEASKREVRDVLADKIEQTAHWRTAKAKQYPMDVRNAHCIRALRMAAVYVRGLPLTDSGPLGPFFEFDRQVFDWKALAPREILTFDSHAAARFFFVNEPRLPAERDFQSLLSRMYGDLLENWAETIRDGSDIPPSDVLSALFDEAGVCIAFGDEEEDDDA
jgi:hypothetical protein